MKTAAMAIVMTLAVATLMGCQTSPRGGSMMTDAGFRISVSTFESSVKQGELQTVTVSLLRDSLFKQDVKLRVTAKGLSVEPASFTIKASDKPDMQLQIAAPKDAAIGDYPVVVMGTPEKGNATSVGFTVKVVAP